MPLPTWRAAFGVALIGLSAHAASTDPLPNTQVARDLTRPVGSPLDLGLPTFTRGETVYARVVGGVPAARAAEAAGLERLRKAW